MSSDTTSDRRPKTAGVRVLEGFGPSFTWGVRQACRWKRLLVVGLLAVAVGAIVGTSIAESAVPPDQYRRWWHRDAPHLLAKHLDEEIFRVVLPLCALLLIGGGFSREVHQRTLVYHLVRPVSRTTVFLSRYLAGIIPAAAVAILMISTACLTSGVELPASFWFSVPLTATAGVIAIGAVYYTLGALFRRGMVAGLIYTFVLENLFGSVSGSIQRLSVMFHVRSIHHSLNEETFLSMSNSLRRQREWELEVSARSIAQGAERLIMESEKLSFETPGTALTVLGCLTVALIALGAWRVSRKDYPLKD